MGIFVIPCEVSPKNIQLFIESNILYVLSEIGVIFFVGMVK